MNSARRALGCRLAVNDLESAHRFAFSSRASVSKTTRTLWTSLRVFCDSTMHIPRSMTSTHTAWCTPSGCGLLLSLHCNVSVSILRFCLFLVGCVCLLQTPPGVQIH